MSLRVRRARKADNSAGIFVFPAVSAMSEAKDRPRHFLLHLLGPLLVDTLTTR